ncbi:MAG: hypothetical protein EAZ25_01700 [Oscillatoriales cyanobacterium]|nr:MAG: hypothetical protein EAZ25_01700 [Oscillatoriales cyanobacterium]
MRDKHQVTEEPCEEKFSRTVLESGGSRERVADFNESFTALRIRLRCSAMLAFQLPLLRSG